MVDVYITIDTECSMGGAWNDSQARPVPPERAILGRIGDGSYGTPLIMEILEQNGLLGTFFVEVLVTPLVNESHLAAVYGEIVARSHDAQLHIHPVFHYYRQFLEGRITRDQLPRNMDLIGTLPIEKQMELLQEGSTIFRKLIGKDPVAFRAGCFGASASTLAALSRVGIYYDSSFNAGYLNEACVIDSTTTNLPWKDGSVWEVPVTNFETGIWRLRGLKPLDVGAVSLLEMTRVLQQSEHLGMSTVVILLHSFTLFKKKDAQFHQLRPDRLVIGRFVGLCEFLRKHSNRFRVVTFSERPQFPASSPENSIPAMGSVVPFCRKLIQGFNRAHWI